MNTFSPVTDADLNRAHTDPAFRQKMLEENMEALLACIKKLRNAPPSAPADAKQLREGVELAVRLAEMIQNVTERHRAF